MSLLFGPEQRVANLNTLLEIERSLWGTTSGQVVTQDRALRHSGVWGSLAAISEAFLSLPLRERLTDTQTEMETFRRPPPWFDEPAPGVPWETWIWQQAWTLASRGRCYGHVTDLDANGYPLTVVPVPDDEVVWRFHQQSKRWITYVGNQEMKRWPLGPLWHCPLYATPGRPQGMSPITLHAETIGVGLAAQQFGAEVFDRGGHPTVVIRNETNKDPGETFSRRIKEKIQGILSGGREPLVLPKGLTLEKWQISPEESQFLDTMGYSGVDVCRIFGVPPFKCAFAISGQSITYQNTMDANADWRVSGLARYVGAFQGHLSRMLPQGRNRKLVFDFAGFLRASDEIRYKIYKLAAEVGQLSGTPVMYTNEMRAKEGLPPVDGGDSFGRMVQPDPIQQRMTQDGA